MQYQVNTPAQLRAVLKGLRQARKLSQEKLGRLLGVNQKRIARIEAAPGVTGFDQITRFVAALGGRLVVEDATVTPQTKSAKSLPSRKSAKASTAKANW